MAQRWYEKATVQAALVGGVFLVVATIIGIQRRDTSVGPSPSDATAQRGPVDKPPQPTLPTTDAPYSQIGLSERTRLRAGLRSLTVAESGRLASKLPSGIYGYAHSSIFLEPDTEIHRVPTYGHLSFEAQKTADGVLLALAFVNLDAQGALSLDRNVTVPTTLYSDFWDEAKYAVLVVASSCNGRNRVVNLDGGSHVNAVDCEPVANKAPKGVHHVP